MFQVKTMSSEDFFFATELANTMNWNMTTEDFQFMRQLEPEGCFILLEDSKRAGIATCISYGKVGWFGNLVVKEENRHMGAGSLLMKNAANYLHSKDVKTIGLYAYPHLVNFYSKLGFLKDSDFAVLHTEHLLCLSAGEALPSVSKRHIQAINRLDSCCFGGNRQNLLESIILEKRNLSYYVSESEEVVGYIAATVQEKNAWIGPLICQTPRVDLADLMVRTVLSKLGGKSIYTVLPKKESALLDTFSGVGFKEDFSITRMFLGEAVARNCIYLAESLERG